MNPLRNISLIYFSFALMAIASVTHAQDSTNAADTLKQYVAEKPSAAIKDIIITLISGGFITAIITATWNAISQRRRRQIEFLQEQIRRLYGPLDFSVKLNESMQARKEEWVDAIIAAIKKDPLCSIRTTSDAAETEEGIIKEYWKQMDETAYQMAKLIQENWLLVDADDVEAFAAFCASCRRHQIEFGLEQKIKIPLSTWVQVEKKGFDLHSKDFLDRISCKNRGKTDQLKKRASKYW